MKQKTNNKLTTRDARCVAQAVEGESSNVDACSPEKSGKGCSKPGPKSLARQMLGSPALVVTTLALFMYSVTLNSVFSTVVEDSGLGSESGGELLTLQSIVYIVFGPLAGTSRVGKNNK